MAKLKPCYCGGTNFDAFTELEPPELGVIRCRTCNCAMHGKNLANAIQKWNERPDSPVEKAARALVDTWKLSAVSRGRVNQVLMEQLDALAAALEAKS